MSNGSESKISEEQENEILKERLKKQDKKDMIESLSGGMGAGSQVNYYHSDVSWNRVERLAGVISVLISIFWIVSKPIEAWAGIQIPFAVVYSSAFGISALGDYILHLMYGTKPEPPDMPFE